MPDHSQQILIAEDDQALLTALIDKFKSAGFNILQARDGEEALRVALASHPDLILLDIIMPVMSGRVMLQKLRQDPWGKSAKVIMLTNLDDVHIMNEALELDSHAYLVKSDLKIDEVVSIVRSRLNE